MKSFLLVVFYVVLFLVAVRYIESRSIYFPMKGLELTPQSAGLAYEDVYFKTSDGIRLNGWFIASPQARFTAVFCHGNAGNIGHRLEKISIVRDLGLNIFIFDYRGYGKSQGRPSEKGLYKDVRAAYDYLVSARKVPKDTIILYGESIGGAVAIDLAHKVPVRALITEETFSSIKDMSGIAYPFIPYFIFSTRFDSVSKIKDVKCPTLIIHSVDDEIVPYNLGRKLYYAARLPKKFLEIRGGHNTAFLDSEKQFREGIKAFLDSL